MKRKNWKTYVYWIIFAELVGVVSGLLAREGIQWFQTSAVKPALTPPGIVFPIVWTILFALMGISAGKVSLAGEGKSQSGGLFLFFLQLILNFAWPILFFQFRSFGLAFFWIIGLWVTIVLMILAFWKVKKEAAWLQLPYLAWVSFATWLNYSVWMLNS